MSFKAFVFDCVHASTDIEKFPIYRDNAVEWPCTPIAGVIFIDGNGEGPGVRLKKAEILIVEQKNFSDARL